MKWADLFAVSDAAEPAYGFQRGRPVLLRVHDEARCAGQHCVIHNPSDHHMRSWPTNWRGDKGVMERTCPHGVGHPDPDDAAYHARMGRDWVGVHGCDGCCSPDLLPEETP